ncbi:hypothetical protein N7519_004770 [Penicillium mononematosum]|uniref:uncharacterized protein n=1 Tax=Penicillium mononematosum TaxID=268346 RepID=UPI0025490DC9|nr:uncharacterized protein N7519_004770 [Penicillium mononematosum]KAJ6189862.1 hypothetical protein N7519_004770 [Penicillium mononematosum]
MNESKKDQSHHDGHDIDNNMHDLSPGEVSKAMQQPQDLFNSEDGEVDFRGVSWQGAAILIAKFQIGLGALSLPSTFHVLGFFPGILCFVILAIMTTVAGYVWREFIGVIYYIYLALVAGAGMLTTSVAFNALSEHGACTMIFVAVACLASFVVGTGFRSLGKIAWLSWVGVAGIVFAIWITAIACLTQSRPAAAPAGPINLDIRVFPKGNLHSGNVGNIHSAICLGCIGDLFLRSFIVITNIAISSIMYAKVGQYLASPALGSAGLLIKKISYGIALPGLLVTAILWSHIAAKYWFVRILRGTRHLQSNTVIHWTVWIGSMAVTVVFGFIIVGVVPFFNDFLSLVGALINPVFTNVLPGFMILFFLAKNPSRAGDIVEDVEREESTSAINWILNAFKAYRNGWIAALTLVGAWFMILAGFFIIVGGTYSTTLGIRASYNNGAVTGVFSCGDNS